MSTKAPTLREAYRDWLKIPEGQLPPDHYALLGLPRFEGDAGKVQQATMARMKIIRPRCLKYHELGTQLLNQVAAANVCLTDAAAKAAYDKTLKTGGVTAAVQLAAKSGAQERARLHQLLGEARKERQAARPGEAAKGKAAARTPAAPKPPDEEVFEITLDDLEGGGDFNLAPADEDAIDDEIERLLAEYDLASERRTKSPARQQQSKKSTAGESPFAASASDDDDDLLDDDDDAATSAESLTDQEKTVLVGCGLVIAAVVLIGGLIAFAMSGSSDSPAVAGGTPPTSVPPPPPSSAGSTLPGAPTPPPESGDPQSSFAAGTIGGEGGDENVFGTPTVGTPMAAPGPAGSPLPSSPISPAPAEARLEYFTGMLTRIEQHADHVLVIVEASSSSSEPPATAGSDAPLPPPGAGPGGPGPYGGEPIYGSAIIEAVVSEPGFAQKILDYRTMAEAVDELLASGQELNLFNGPSGAGPPQVSDTVVLTGRRTDRLPTRGGQWVVELTAIERVNQPETRAEVGKRRNYVQRPSAVHNKRTPLHQLLRGFNTGLRSEVTLTGVPVPVGGGAYFFQPQLSNQTLALDMKRLEEGGSRTSPDDPLNLLAAGGAVEMTIGFRGTFDDSGYPRVEVASIRATNDPALAGAPGRIGPGGIGPAVASAPGGEAVGPFTPRAPEGDAFGEPDGGAGLPAAAPGDKWYIVRVYDRTTKSNTYSIVQGLDARKQTIESYRGSGLTASAEVGAFKTQDAAFARLQILQTKEARRMGGFP
jgi:hypothetical protein